MTQSISPEKPFSFSWGLCQLSRCWGLSLFCVTSLHFFSLSSKYPLNFNPFELLGETTQIPTNLLDSLYQFS